MKTLRIWYYLLRSTLAVKKSDRELAKAERRIYRAKYFAKDAQAYDREYAEAERIIARARGYTMDARAWSDLAKCYQEEAAGQ